jgi:DtxR family Mn-dependent transcriptional regulator
VLRYLADRGIRLDTVLTVAEQRAFAGDATVTLEGSASSVDLGATAASAVWVSARA